MLMPANTSALLFLVVENGRMGVAVIMRCLLGVLIGLLAMRNDDFFCGSVRTAILPSGSK